MLKLGAAAVVCGTPLHLMHVGGRMGVGSQLQVEGPM